MTWNLTRKTDPAELAALNDEVVHQRIIGTKLADGRSVCDQTDVQCSTSARGEGVTCPLCLRVVATWRAKADAEEARRAASLPARKRRAARAYNNRLKLEYVNLGVWITRELCNDLDLLIEAGQAPSRRALIADVLARYRDAHLVQLTRIRAARAISLQNAQAALQFAGRTDGAPSPSRFTTDLKARLQTLQNDLATEGALTSRLMGAEPEE